MGPFALTPLMAANMQHGGRSNEQRAVAPQLLLDLVTLLAYFISFGAGGGVGHTPSSTLE